MRRACKRCRRQVVRDDFLNKTKETLAKRAAYRCSNPDCRMQTVGAAAGHDGVVNVGVASHIAAAAPGGPRYDASMTREQRRSQSNGIWLCQNHGKLVDSDNSHFTVGTLRSWKTSAETESLEAIARG